jgi:Na+:H+ antiporter, NhaA family
VSRSWRDALAYYPLLPIGALIALVWANTASDSYFRLAQALAFPVNDIGVAFGIASLAQDVVEALGPGHALRWRTVRLPIVIAIGGILGTAVAYATYLHFTDEQILGDGWRIACGVDVFVCVALARLVFRRRAAITTVILFAVTSDAIALILVSRRPFATSADAVALSLIVLAVVVSALLRRFGARSMWGYLAFAGPIAWLGCYWSGLQPALALLPLVPFFPHAPRPLDDLGSDLHEHARLSHFESVFAYPLQAVAFLFGLTNAGVLLRGIDTGTWAVLTASLIGRPAGILLSAALFRDHLFRWKELFVIALIGSVGLAFALFLSTSVFPEGPLLTQTKLGAIATLAGSGIAIAAARALRVGRFA